MPRQFKVRDKRNKGWFYLDNEYLNGYAKIFGAVGTAIYVSLCRHADAEQKCFPSQKLIAAELNIAERTVRNYLNLFARYYIISISRERDEKTKRWLNNVYWLLDKSEWLKPEAIVAYGKPEANKHKSQRQQLPHKDTKRIKNTNTDLLKTGLINPFKKNERLKSPSEMSQEELRRAVQ